MWRFGLGLCMAFGSIFSMCQGGPVPKGCCEHGDRLDVLMTPAKDPTQNNWQERCDQMGGRLEVRGDDEFWCVGVDF
jgi:hypothetical protein